MYGQEVYEAHVKWINRGKLLSRGSERVVQLIHSL